MRHALATALQRSATYLFIGTFIFLLLGSLVPIYASWTHTATITSEHVRQVWERGIMGWAVAFVLRVVAELVRPPR